jgi:hypothetical protein
MTSHLYDVGKTFSLNVLRILRSCDRQCIGTNFFTIKPTRCTKFINSPWQETLRVLGISCVHHQEFIHCTLSNGIVIQVCRQLSSRTRTELVSTSSVLVLLESCMTYTIAECTVDKLMMDRGTVRNM